MGLGGMRVRMEKLRRRSIAGMGIFNTYQGEDRAESLVNIIGLAESGQ